MIPIVRPPVGKWSLRTLGTPAPTATVGSEACDVAHCGDCRSMYYSVCTIAVADTFFTYVSTWENIGLPEDLGQIQCDDSILVNIEKQNVGVKFLDS